MPQPNEDLIFDRVQADVINKTAKGYYNASDLNRVEEWTYYISDLLNTYGYVNNITTKTNWTSTDFVNVSNMERIRSNINTLKTIFATMSTTPALPENLNRMDISKANAIEKILSDVNDLIGEMIKSWKYAGDIVSGEGYFNE